jgi:RNA polymerase sigma-70 factor (ECF subfamily)
MDIVNQLAIKAKAGDAESFGQIFDILSDSIYRFLAFRLKNRDDAEEMTNQVFLEAWQGIKRYDGKRSFKTWIFAIARYTLIDFYRKNRATVNLEAVMELADHTDIESDIKTKSESELVLAELNQLPELYQAILKLRFLEELEYSEIAQMTGKTENSVRVIVKRGLGKIRDSLSASRHPELGSGSPTQDSETRSE